VETGGFKRFRREIGDRLKAGLRESGDIPEKKSAHVSKRESRKISDAEKRKNTSRLPENRPREEFCAMGIIWVDERPVRRLGDTGVGGHEE